MNQDENKQNATMSFSNKQGALSQAIYEIMSKQDGSQFHKSTAIMIVKQYKHMTKLWSSYAILQKSSSHEPKTEI